MSASQKKKFASVPISKISSEVILPTDIYLYISDKYIKFKERGDQISAEKFDFFLARNLKQVYVAFNELTVFMEWVKLHRFEKIEKIMAHLGPEYRELAEKNEKIKEKLYETLADKEISVESVAVLKESVQEFLTEIKKLTEPQQILQALLNFNRSIAEHSSNVAQLSIYIALVLGVGRQSQLEHLYTGALFHDYGKAKIPVNVLENKTNLRYSQAIQDHPLKGAEMLKKSKTIPMQVIRIVKEHHEQFNGKGFPDGLKGDEIYELSQIVAMANIIDEELEAQKGPGPREKDYKRIAKILKLDQGKRFDPKQALKVSEAISLSIPDV